MRRAITVIAPVFALVGLTLPGCFTHACEGDVIAKPFGEAAGEGHFLDDTTWESMPLDGKWLFFPGGRTWKFRVPAWERENRTFVSLAAYVSTAEVPAQVQTSGAADNWTEATGNLTEVSQVSPGNFRIDNATCSDFYVRVVAHAGDARDSGARDAQSE